MVLKPGSAVPAFSTVDQDGTPVRSEDLQGKRYVLYFYPHDDTLICTRQACSFEENRADFEALDVPIFGVSPNSEGSHKRFAEKHGLRFRLLVDRDRTLSKAFDAQGLLGRTARITYIVGPDGTVEDVHRAELSGAGHARWAKERVAALGAATARA